MPRLIAIALAAVALAASTGIAAAAHRPSHLQRGKLHNAVTRSRLMPPPIRAGHFKLRRPRISNKGPWARAKVKPTGQASGRLDPVLTVFKHRRHRWRVVALGTAGVGCSHPRLPRRVRRDLHLRCP